MCCFSRPVKDVSSTKIFARWTSLQEGVLRQCVVYQMKYEAAEDLAMVLPIPVPFHYGEKPVQFVNLEKHADIFDRLHECFQGLDQTASGDTGGYRLAPAPKLEVVQVGSYEASFVPTMKDFARLDERFRLPAGVWESLPQYAAWGFAVFKLKAVAKTVHPMAFTFPHPKETRGLFFPTVHIHDGAVHRKAKFDHTLYTQRTDVRAAQLMNWHESPELAESNLKKDYGGMVLLKGHVHRKELKGILANEDMWV